MKKVFKIIGFVLLFVVVIAIGIPYLFKGKMIALIKEKVNQNINAKVDFKDVDISVFRHFPKLAIGINILSVVGINEFEGDTLIAAKQLDLSMNLWSAIAGKEIDIYGIDITDATINTIVNKLGKSNWVIAKIDSRATTTLKEKKAIKLKLDHYSLHNASVKYRDYVGNIFLDISKIEHSGSGNFAADIFTLVTKTNIEKLSYLMKGVKYINEAKTQADLDLQVDTKQMKFEFNTDKINLNDLKIATKGFFQLVNDSTYAMDISFNAPSTDFKNTLSLIPTIYQNSFSTIKTSGNAILNGFVKGNYSPKQIPAYQFNLKVENGFFQYPDLPIPVKDINIDMKINNPDGITNHTVVDISKAHLSLAGEPFDFKLFIKTPISDLYVDAVAKGTLDLGKVSQFIKMPTITKLQGLLNANVAIHGAASAMQKNQIDKFNAIGGIDLTNFQFVSKDYAAGVSINILNIEFTPNNVTLNNLVGKFMQTNFSAYGYINNILPFMLQNKPLDGVMNMKADNIDLNALIGVSNDTVNKGIAESKPFIVPKNLNLTLNAIVDNVHYNKLDMAALSGSLLIADETVKMNNVKAKALNGNLAVSGYYSTKLDNKKPDIALTYNVTNVDIQKTFYAFNSIQKLMPIGQFIAGKLTSQLTVTGKLGNNMMPDMNSLTGNGNFLMLEGLLSKFEPVNKVAQTLNMQQLQNISLRDVKTFFEFTSGQVFVKPFVTKVNDIDMEIGGSHSFTQDMDYTINMKIPRAMMGAAGNNFINNLAAQATAKGLPVKVSDIVNMQLKLGGSIKNPTVKTDLKQTATSLTQDLKQQANAFVQNKIDSTKKAVKAAIKDTVKSLKQQVINDVKNEAIKQIFKTGDTTKADPKKTLEEAGKNLLKNFNPFKKG
jgi:hypothetical protein